MVRVLVILFFLLPALSQGADVQVTAQMESDNYENRPLKGSVMITHNENDTIDKSSFRMDSKSLEVEFIRRVKIDPANPLVVDIYQFQLPPKSAGLYALPPISLKVGKKEYHSIRQSYEVLGAQNAPTTSPSSPSAPAAPSSSSSSQTTKKASPPGSAMLKLEASIEGKDTLYPGQRTKLVYRFYYRGDVELTKEVLPLLDAKGMVKIGEKEIKDYTQGDLSVNEISQEVEAVKPGELSFGPSLIEGSAYTGDAFGRRHYSSEKLSSQAPAVVVNVLAFPEKEKPGSFNGAVGQYQFKTALLSTNEMEVGDTISLSLEISGRENLKSVPLPEVCCQPGFSGFFQLDDLPPNEEIKDDRKLATFKIRPLSADIREIPRVEFSFFNPVTSQYEVLHSDPIPIKVRPSQKESAKSLKKETRPPEQGQQAKPPKRYQPGLIEIEGIDTLKNADLHNLPFGTWWALAIIPLGIAAIAYQLALRSYFKARRKEIKIKTSNAYLQEAFQQQKGSPLYFDSLEKALKQALFEIGTIPQADIAIENLPKDGLAGEVRNFLSKIEEERFAKNGKLDYEEINTRAEQLWSKLKGRMVR